MVWPNLNCGLPVIFQKFRLQDKNLMIEIGQGKIIGII